MRVPLPGQARVLVLAPIGRDALLAASVLEEFGIPAEALRDPEMLRERLDEGASALLLSEEALLPQLMRFLEDFVQAQPVWSDLPILIFTGTAEESDQRLDLLREALGNVTFLERPFRTVTLVTAVRSALRARRRQFELRDSLAKSEEAVRQRDNFLAMLGHELRNPLAAIMMATELMERSKIDAFAKQRGLIGRQTKHLARLVDDLLDVARITTGKVVLRREATDLADIVRRGLLAADGAIRHHGLTVALQEKVPKVGIDGDPVRIEQIFSNLLTNAIKYTPDGGRIDVEIDREGNQGILRVRDTGVGIAPEMLLRVFELFSQADKTLDRSQGGLGIGLSVARRLVELHGGTIEALSEGLGQGSTFVVRLPLRTAAFVTDSSEKPREGERPRRIVIVEDQEDFREVFQCALEGLGHQVEAASDGIQGLDLVLRNRPDVAFVDIGLPGLDGYEMARRVRSAVNGSIKLVAITGYGQPDDRQRALAAGFDLHLTKPVDMKVVRAVLSASRSLSVASA